MSRATRPLRRVRGAELDRLRLGIEWRTVCLCWRALRLPAVAYAMCCRPAQLRRCLLGLPVSARAANKILAAASGCNIRREPGR